MRRLTLSVLLATAALPAFADAPRVVTDIAPVHSLVSQVMAGVGTPDLLLDGSADPHSVQLKPSQARAVSQADLVVWVGEELEPWLARVLAGLGDGQSMALLDLPGTQLRSFDEASSHDHDHAEHAHEGDDHADADHAEHEGDDHAGHDHAEHEHEGHDHAGDDHGHDHSGVDPHAWLAPANAQAWLIALAEELGALDPENAATYPANADAAAAAIGVQSQEIAARLAPYEGAEIVTFHDAFSYFTDSYGIEVLGSVRPGDASTPSAAAVDALREAVAEHGVTCAFGEPNHDPAMLETLASEAGLTVGTLDATGALLSAGPELYGAMMDNLATALEGCLSR